MYPVPTECDTFVTGRKLVMLDRDGVLNKDLAECDTFVTRTLLIVTLL
jgi:histidinol phosphatase-like enzyme